MNTDKTFDQMTKEEQEDSIDFDLKEIAHWLGGWEELKERIKVLEDNANEASWYRSQNDY